MVKWERIFLREDQIGILYKLLGSIVSDGCNISIIPESGEKEGKSLVIFGENTMLWHKKRGYIEENDLQVLHINGTVEDMYNYSLGFDICENHLYGKKNWVRFSSDSMRLEGIL